MDEDFDFSDGWDVPKERSASRWDIEDVELMTSEDILADDRWDSIAVLTMPVVLSGEQVA